MISGAGIIDTSTIPLTSGASNEKERIWLTVETHGLMTGENKKLQRRLKVRKVALGSLATEGSVSIESDDTSSRGGMKRLSQKCPTKLMAERNEKKTVEVGLAKNAFIQEEEEGKVSKIEGDLEQGEISGFAKDSEQVDEDQVNNTDGLGRHANNS